MADQIRVLIVDDIPETRDHLTKLLGFETDIEVVGSAASGGESLSLQWHHEKDETIAVLSGDVEIDLGTSEDALRTVPVAPGSSVHVTPGLLHRVRALTDAVLVEASTAAPGWREDIVRLDDSYGRRGTQAP